MVPLLRLSAVHAGDVDLGPTVRVARGAAQDHHAVGADVGNVDVAVQFAQNVHADAAGWAFEDLDPFGGGGGQIFGAIEAGHIIRVRTGCARPPCPKIETAVEDQP